MTIVMAGGGSGGHCYPIRALLHYAHSIGYAGPITWIGTRKSMEETLAWKLIDELPTLSFPFSFYTISAGKWRREKSLTAIIKNLRDLVLCSVGIIQSLVYLWRCHATVVFCKGGFVALPVVIAARILRRPIIVHESDVSPGLVNRIAARLANIIFCGFPDVIPNSIVTGQILSTEIINGDSKIKKTITDWIGKRQCILVMGGSLGAMSLYDAIYDYIMTSKHSNRCRCIVGGTLTTNTERRQTISNVRFFSSCSQAIMGSLYACADLAIMRAGTTSLAEAQLHHVPKIILPLLITHDQERNAQRYHKTYGDIVILQNNDSWIQDLTHILDSWTQKKQHTDHNTYDDPRSRIRDTLVTYT
ncbi:MAG: glycosyltransferase [Candidatus Absconditabacterales bacterium]|nr:glycosyltransferase [Candidatus Absconditabacterales bacterium]